MNAEQFEAMLDEYRAQNIHFLHLKTNTRDWFFIIDDSYYLTYRDDKKEIVVSWLVKPKDDAHETATSFTNTKTWTSANFITSRITKTFTSAT